MKNIIVLLLYLILEIKYILNNDIKHIDIFHVWIENDIKN